MEKIKLLHIDDDTVEQELTRLNIQRTTSDFDITCVTSASKGLEIVQGDSIDCILCDYQMPNMDGMEFLQHLRTRNISIPFIFHTGQGNEQIAAEALRSGADDYYTKDMGFAHYERLVNSIKSHVRSYQRNLEKHRYKKDYQKTENKYRLLFERENDAIIIYDPMTFEILDANPAAARMYGYEPEELLGMSCLSLSAEEQESRKAAAETLAKGRKEVKRRQHRRKDGTVFPVDLDNYEFKFEGHRQLFAIVRDVTEQVKAEEHLLRAKEELETQAEELREAYSNLEKREQVFRKMFEENKSPMLLIDISNAMIYDANATAAEFYGYSKEQLCSMHISDINTRSDEEISRNVKEVSANRANHFVLQHLKADGERATVDVYTSLLEFEGETRLFSIIHDISERVRAEKALQESEQRYRTFVENASEIIYSLTPDGHYTYVTPNWPEFIGEPAEDVIGKPFAPYVHPDDLPRCEDFLRQTIEDPDPPESVEYRVKHRSGDWYWHTSTVSVLSDEEGNITGFTGIARDITDLKKAEQRLKVERDRLDMALENTDIGLWDWQVQSGELTINDTWAEMLGYTKAELEPFDINTWRSLAEPKSLDRSNAILAEYFAGKRDKYECEVKMIHKDGHPVRIIDRGKIVEWDDKGEPKRMIGTHILNANILATTG